MDPTRIFPDDYVPNAEGATAHKQWVKSNPVEAAKWATFRDKAIVYETGDALTPPSMATKYGKALVAAGKLHVSVTDIGSAEPTPLPPDPPPPPPTGTLIYSHTYTGSQAVAPNYGWDYNFLQEGGSSATIIANAIGPGLPAMSISLPAGVGGHVEGQKQWQPPPGTGGFTIGETRYFGFQFKLPSNWQNPTTEGWGALIAQLYYPVCLNCPFGLYLFTDHARIQLLTGQQTYPTITREYDNVDGHPQGPAPRPIPVGRLTLNVWHTIILEVTASYEATTSPGYSGGTVGSFRSWHRIASDPGSPTLQASYPDTTVKTNVPTMQWGQCSDNATWPKNSVGPVNSPVYGPRYLHQKFGFYTGPASWIRTYQSGNYRIGTTFDVVAAQMV